MNIQQAKDGHCYRLTLAGRLDASWRDQLEAAIESAIRGGEHHLRLDMAGVEYISSAGIRLLLQSFKKLKGIDGSLLIVNPSVVTENVLRMSGLPQLIAKEETAAAPKAAAATTTRETANARFEFYPGAAESIAAQGLGEPAALETGAKTFATFQSPALLLGLGAIGHGSDDHAHRMGEMIAVNGNVAYQPTDGANQPDYMAPHGNFLAEGKLLLGLSANALPTRLARFESDSVIGQTELAQTILDEAKADAAVIVAVTETAGLVGATIRQSPAVQGDGKRFDFPAIRDWLSFSPDRVHRDTTSLLIGFIAKPGSKIDAWLRPLGDGLLAHCHAAVFPYHPLRKGEITLPATVDAMFNDQRLLAVTHLLADPRELIGAGESEFYRGAVWYAPLTF